MSKRKRTEDEDEDEDVFKNEIESSTSLHQQRKLEASLPDFKNTLLRVLKLARGYERQKFSRRQKRVKPKHGKAELTRLANELSLLKACSIFFFSLLDIHMYTFVYTRIACGGFFPLTKPRADVRPRSYGRGAFVQDAREDQIGGFRTGLSAVHQGPRCAVPASRGCGICQCDREAV